MQRTHFSKSNFFLKKNLEIKFDSILINKDKKLKKKKKK